MPRPKGPGPVERLWRAAGFELQNEAADAAGITPRTLANWHAGNHLPARRLKLESAAKGWRTTVDRVLRAHAEQMMQARRAPRKRALSAA